MTFPDPTPPINTFGIPVPGRTGGFRYAELHPLNPWLIAGHEGLYAPVDQTEERFQEFAGRFRDAAGLENFVEAHHNPITIASGIRKSGKTSLLNRCADHLGNVLSTRRRSDQPGEWRLKRIPADLDFIALGDPRETRTLRNALEKADLDDEMNGVGIYIHDAIVERLWQRHQWFRTALSVSTQTQENLKSPDPSKRYEELIELLDDQDHHVVVTIPNVELLANGLFGKILITGLDHGKQRIFFFLEALDEDVNKSILEAGVSEEEQKRLIRLKIGHLDHTDCVKFIKQRHGHSFWTEPHIELTEAVFREDAFKDHSPELYYCVGSLQQKFFGEVAKSIADGATLIDLTLADHETPEGGASS